MRGDIVYRVYGLHEGRDKEWFFGAFRTRDQAEAKITELLAKKMRGRNWADQHHDKGFVIREAVVDTNFEIPRSPKPRDKYAVRYTATNEPGTWSSIAVEVCKRSPAGLESVCQYQRNYSMLQTFEPFRRGDRELALISRGYTQTGVLDLTSGDVIAEEPDESGSGFCPVGFYVPDWWDINDGSVIPGSEYWNDDCEWPNGDFGFVWGCYWGDDSSWKIQYLDLSQVEEGIIRRDDRFGYVELAASNFISPCLAPDQNPGNNSKPPHFITVTRYDGATQVVFSVEMSFDLESGQPKEWKRLKVANFED